ncbi:roadblock/LC7 domain-containing protein [Methanocaldococcus fervens]|nr:roadblock/LC7 domain-containing protein [Methanocaldococcus fervens]
MLFLILFILGVTIGAGIYCYREKEKRKTYKFIEMEIIEGLKELKPYIAPDENKEYTEEFDLVEIALSHDIEDIVVVNDEGLVVASTLKGGDDFGAIGLGIFEYIKKFHDNIKKVVIQKGDNYIHIYPLKCNNENLYAIIESKIMLETIEEKEILRKVNEVLKKYFGNVENIKKENINF